MALNLGHQLGALCGTPMVPETSATTVAEHSMAPVAVFKSQAASSVPGQKCLVQRTELDQKSPPFRSGMRQPDLSVACQALVDNAQAVTAAAEAFEVVKEHVLSGAGEKGIGVPVYVMMPLDTVKEGGKGLNRRKAMNASLMALKSAGVTGLMVDVWWGLVEKERPGKYDWRGYDELMEMASRIGLKVQAVMSFHQCGGNVGDCVTIPLPTWVIEELDKDPDLAYTDQWGRRNYEYVSLGCDTLPVLKGRSPVQCYSDFMRAFRDHFSPLLGTTIVEIQVGMGPAGELRYPSYPELNGTWRFPGIGAFQCYDKYMLSSLKAAAEAVGKPEWGHGGPTDAGCYNSWPEDAPFFRSEGGWDSPYGEFFLSWYSQKLIEHGERIVSSANSVFDSTGVKISVKVAGIHWHYGTRSHASELTAGYYNTRSHNGYLPIARMMGRYNAVFNFTCVEMRNHEQPENALCRPEDLVRQVAEATREAGVLLAGENALPRYDDTALQQITSTAMAGEGKDSMVAFTYLRMSPDLFQPENWQKFVAFVRKMAEGSEAERRQCREQLERERENSVYISWPPVKQATAAQQ